MDMILSKLQEIFLTQGLNPGPTLQADALPSEPPGKRSCRGKDLSKINILICYYRRIFAWEFKKYILKALNAA